MWFWWFMLVCNMTYSLAMIIGGRYMWKHMPKKINSACGYRSKRSTINKDTWSFAHKNCGRRWWIIGWIMFFPTVFIQLPFYGQSDGAVGTVSLVICIVECAVMLLSIIPTEMALKKTFTDDGQRKQ